VFHPKIYYFEKGADGYAIIGSSNFTKGGTATNFEAAVMLRAERNDNAMVRIRALVNEAWEAGDLIDPAFVQRYRLLHASMKRARSALDKRQRAFLSGSGTPPPVLEMDWSDYVEAVRSSQYHDADAGVSLLRKAKGLFASVAEFRDLPEPERRALGGVLQQLEVVAGVSGKGWKMFGAMRGSGVFVEAIRLNSPGVSAALACIPDAGEVDEDHYFAFAEVFQHAFLNAARRAGVPPASRLLAMKRPDTFLCIDGRNWEAIRDDLRGKKALPNFEEYWAGVIQPLRTARWYNSPRPRGRDGELWDRRMAILDSVIYREPGA
jgi:hypothetical protein